MTKRKQPDPPALEVIDGLLKLDGKHQCYFLGDECLIPVRSLKEAAGQRVWYRTSIFDTLKYIEVPA